ncbi:MAG: MXAN_2562 family outer membrane beta-barrel protein [Deltaproteobacteria bacterium]|nr:MXAN_2562 family outer membrane beta-barrel protein [Deltaproteobacteria bacterium]
MSALRTSVLSAAALFSLSPLASAQTYGTQDRRPEESRQDFALELRFGSFTENIDNQVGMAANGPFRQIFCSTRDATAASTATVGCPARFRFGAEFDWQILRLGPVGSFGVGLVASFGSAVADAPALSGMSSTDATQWRRSAQQTTLNVVQGAALAVLRIDGLARRVRWLPVVPFAKAGLALAPWWVTSGEANARDTSGNDAVGLSQGFYFAGGLAVMLDTFEPHVARQWDQQSGVNHSYVFFELNYQYLGGITRRTLDVGGLAWTAGVNVEF